MPKPRKAPQLYEAPSSTVILGPALVWVGLLLLLAINIGLTFLPLGQAKTAVNLAVAVVQASLMFAVFMRLNRASALVKLTAGAGLVWLSFLFLIGSADFLTRPLISP